MSKTLVSKDEIITDPALTIIKAFRIANKRAGEAKRAYQAEALIASTEPSASTDSEIVENENDSPACKQLMATYKSYCDKIHELKLKAEELGFHIWVNFDGKTGHTYPKDYKLTSDAENNFELHTHKLEQIQAQASDLLGGNDSDDPDSDADDPETPDVN